MSGLTLVYLQVIIMNDNVHIRYDLQTVAFTGGDNRPLSIDEYKQVESGNWKVIR